MRVGGFLRIAVIFIILLSGLYLFYRAFIYSPVIFGLRDDFKEAVPLQAVPSGISGIRGEDCGICHKDIYEEWKSSYHAMAFTDPFFQSFWRKDRNMWVCLNCHAPLVNQQPFLIRGLKRGSIERPIKEVNQVYSKEFQKEGITCAACHVRDGVILGPYKDVNAPHPTKFDPAFLSPKICYRCHQVPGGPFQFYNGGPCATYLEFEANPYSKKGYTCQTCHMPEVIRPSAEGSFARKGGRHLWQGGHSPEMIKKAIKVNLKQNKDDYSPGDTVKLILTLTNRGAGHRIPTGDPDRFFSVKFRVINRDGRVLKEKIHVIGRWILWWPVIVEFYENRIPPLKSRVYTFDYRIPWDAGEERQVVVEVAYDMMTERMHRKLRNRYGLAEHPPYEFLLYKNKIALKK